MDDVEKFKKLGNEALTAKNYDSAVDYYTKAIELDSCNHILFSNRSAAYASKGDYSSALVDAKKTVELNPSWPKGYSRLGLALAYLGRTEEAKTAYRTGLEHDPSNALLNKALSDLDNVRTTMPDFTNGQSEFMKDPQFLTNFLKYMQNPSSVPYDPRFDSFAKNMEEQFKNSSFNPNNQNSSEPQTKPTGNPASSKPVDPEPVSQANPEKLALEEKEKGNAFYKKGQFEEALQHYEKAQELDSKNIVFMNNIAACYYEMGKYKDCIKMSKEAVKVGNENRACFKMIARAFARIGTTKMKQGKVEKAIHYYNKSLAEFRDPAVVKKVKEIEKKKKEDAEKAYLNPEIAEQERVKGNEFFSSGNFPEAINHYTEAIKRNPKDYRIYSNRAACFTKLMEFPLALKDSETCISLEPKFIKGYLRKGNALLAMKRVFVAQSAFEAALKLDSLNKEALDGLNSCRELKSKLTPEQIKEQASHDPEIQAILTDPAMRSILEQMQHDPQAVMAHMRDPNISQKIYKLMEAGIIQTR